MSRKRRICFVTGTRAEFGLMVRTLKAIDAHSKLELQIIVTGTHLARSRGKSIDQIQASGLTVNKIVKWDTRDVSANATAMATGRAISYLTEAYEELDSEIVLIVGDRVEAFAAASAGHISGRIVAHVHGGDRALGQVDDALRHAISKLSHLHFPATKQSADRLCKLGEDAWRIVQSGSPGIDGIIQDAADFEEVARLCNVQRRRFALLILHPTTSDEAREYQTARRLQSALRHSGIGRVIGIYPNTDPGSDGITRRWDELTNRPDCQFFRNLSRQQFLGLLRDCAFLIGNSSSGIIEAASFGTPVIDIGQRQQGRERGKNVVQVDDSPKHIARAIASVWREGSPIRFPKRNIYGSGAAKIIAKSLASLQIDARLKRKLIAY